MPNFDAPGYKRACRAVRDDPDFGPLIGKLVGDSMGATRFDESSVINRALQLLVREDSPSAINEDAIKQEVATLRDYVRATERLSYVLIPLPGLKSALFPLEIEEGLQIDVLTDDEINTCAMSGILAPLFPSLTILSADECVGVRIATRTAAVIRTPGDDAGRDDSQIVLASPHRFGERSYLRFQELVEDVLFVLRLAGPEFISTRGSVYVQRGHRGVSQASNTRPTHQFVHTNYEIDEATATTISEIWRTMRDQRAPSLPPICIRRFNRAMERLSLEDSIVDHVIAAEALFLRDSGDPGDRGELRFRLALRASAFLNSIGRPRRATFKFMKRAYDLRSEIAHGGNAPQEVSVPGQRNVSLSQFVNDLGQLMRDCFRRAVEEYGARPDFATHDYWDDLLFGDQVGS